MIKTVYIDTSVVGGKFDIEFEFWTNLFFKSVEAGEFKIVISNILKSELEEAPENVRSFLNNFPDEHKLFVEFDETAEKLAQKYISESIVGHKSMTDCRHIAIATVNEIEIVASWNFKHIVNLNKIRLYNGVNLKEGYRIIEIRTPREIINYEG